jgi:hypothetical protein
VAKKAQKRSDPKKASTPKSAKAARRPAGKATTKASAGSKRTTAPSRPTPPSAGPSIGERAERLRDDILRSKLTHPDPWTYASKARAWGDRAQVLVEQIVVQGHTPAALRTLEILHAEVEGDRDFQEARRLF